MARSDQLAAAIARDILARPEPQSKYPSCFSCGRTYSRGEGRFCSERCREGFDAGVPPYDPDYVRKVSEEPSSAWRVVAGPPGVNIGSPLYAPILERDERRRRELEAKRGGELIRPRRLCACGAKLPVWIDGRKVSDRRKYCLACSPTKPRKAPSSPSGAIHAFEPHEMGVSEVPSDEAGT